MAAGSRDCIFIFINEEFRSNWSCLPKLPYCYLDTLPLLRALLVRDFSTPQQLEVLVLWWLCQVYQVFI